MDTNPMVSVSSDLQVQDLLIRRGSAMHQSSLIFFPLHEKLRNRLMQALTRPPPEGYAKVGLGQVKRADEEFFNLLALRCRTLKAVGDKLALDDHVDATLEDSRFTTLLAPLPKAVGGRVRSRSPRRVRKEKVNGRQGQRWQGQA